MFLLSGRDRTGRVCDQVYYPPFVAAIDAGVASVMCGYNKANGVDVCGSEQLLTHDLRRKMRFRGFVVSDVRVWSVQHRVFLPRCTAASQRAHGHI